MVRNRTFRETVAAGISADYCDFEVSGWLFCLCWKCASVQLQKECNTLALGLAAPREQGYFPASTGRIFRQYKCEEQSQLCISNHPADQFRVAQAHQENPRALNFPDSSLALAPVFSISSLTPRKLYCTCLDIDCVNYAALALRQRRNERETLTWNWERTLNSAAIIKAATC